MLIFGVKFNCTWDEVSFVSMFVGGREMCQYIGHWSRVRFYVTTLQEKEIVVGDIVSEEFLLGFTSGCVVNSTEVDRVEGGNIW